MLQRHMEAVYVLVDGLHRGLRLFLVNVKHVEPVKVVVFGRDLRRAAWPCGIIVRRIDVAQRTRLLERAGRQHRRVEQNPRWVAQAVIQDAPRKPRDGPFNLETLRGAHQHLVRLRHDQVKAQRGQQRFFVKQNAVAPFLELVRLLVCTE